MKDIFDKLDFIKVQRKKNLPCERYYQENEKISYRLEKKLQKTFIEKWKLKKDMIWIKKDKKGTSCDFM